MAARLAALDVVPPGAPLDFVCLADDEWHQLLAVVRAERLEPQLAGAVTKATTTATPSQIDQAQSLHGRAMATTLLLDRKLLEIAALFDGAGVDFLALKGAAVAHLDRPDPSWRAYGDVDLLVPAPHIDTAERLLADAGGRRSYRSPRPDFDRRFGKGSSFRMADGLEVDLHRTLALGPFGLTIEPRSLFAGRESFALGGRGVLALDRPRRFLHACYHAVLGRARPRLVPLLDLIYTAPVAPDERAVVLELARQMARRRGRTRGLGGRGRRTRLAVAGGGRSHGRRTRHHGPATSLVAGVRGRGPHIGAAHVERSRGCRWME